MKTKQSDLEIFKLIIISPKGFVEQQELLRQVQHRPSPTSNNSTSGTDSKDASVSQASGDKAWTDEEDALLQEGLRKYPASMEKNERWKSISACVPGRSKKECVERFKAIREAVKKGKN